MTRRTSEARTSRCVPVPERPDDGAELFETELDRGVVAKGERLGGGGHRTGKLAETRETDDKQIDGNKR